MAVPVPAWQAVVQVDVTWLRDGAPKAWEREEPEGEKGLQAERRTEPPQEVQRASSAVGRTSGENASATSSGDDEDGASATGTSRTVTWTSASRSRSSWTWSWSRTRLVASHAVTQ